MRYLAFFICVVLLLTSGCGSGSNSDPQPAQFTVSVVPTGMDVVANQPCILLVTVADAVPVPGGNGLVEITATCPNAAVSIDNELILPGEVAEATFTPTGEPDGEWTGGGATVPPSNILTVVVTGSRNGLQQSATASLHLFQGTGWQGEEWPEADAMRDMFIDWLAVEQPALGINDQTQWSGVPIVHIGPAIGRISDDYLYFSDEWEMYIEWAYSSHAPLDFAGIGLRQRYQETGYELTFGVESYSAVPFEPVSGDPGELKR